MSDIIKSEDPFLPTRADLKGMKDEIFALAESMPKLIELFYQDMGMEFPDTYKKQLDFYTQGVISGRYEEGNNIYDTSALSSILYGGKLSPKALREISKQCSIISTCKKRLVRKVASTPWIIKEREDEPKSPTLRKRATAFFRKPMLLEQGFNFSLLMRRSLDDLIDLDWSLIERVRSKSGKIRELYPLDTALYSIKEKKGAPSEYVVEDYLWEDDGANPKVLKPENVLSLMNFPKTSSPYGTPIIEALLEEIGALIFSTIHIRKSFTEGEIPEGFLDAGPISPSARDRLEAQMAIRRGMPWKLFILYGIAGAKWIDIKRSHRDQELSELRKHIERIIYRNYGFSQLEMADTESVNRSTAREEKNIGRSDLYEPILDYYKEWFDRVLAEDLSMPILEFKWYVKNIEDLESMMRGYGRAIEMGGMSPNQLAKELGNDPVEGGDERFIRLGNELIPLRLLPKYIPPSMREPTNGNGNGNGGNNNGDNNDGSEENESEEETQRAFN